MAELDVQIPVAFQSLFRPARFKVFWGGRGSTKSWSFARALLATSTLTPLRIGCFRELQSSIDDSVHHLLDDQIRQLDMRRDFKVQRYQITSKIGSQFIFDGLRHNTQEIKSMEGLDIVWVEEAQAVSKRSWEILIPTIRKAGSEIWVSFNPDLDEDDTFVRFIKNAELLRRAEGGRVVIKKVSYRDNPWLTPELERARLYLKATDPDAYANVWEGDTLTISEAVIFGKRTVISDFETPATGVRFYHGADFGFANDPNALIRNWISEDGMTLFIDMEAFGHGIEIDEIPALYDTIPTSREWPIYADSARPETISYLRRAGFMISGAKKWPGSVEDGIAHLKGFRNIVIHPRCKNMRDEARHYKYKVDNNGNVLPIVVDKNNHGWDSVRYSLDGYIKARMPEGDNLANRLTAA